MSIPTGAVHTNRNSIHITSSEPVSEGRSVDVRKIPALELESLSSSSEGRQIKKDWEAHRATLFLADLDEAGSGELSEHLADRIQTPNLPSPDSRPAETSEKKIGLSTTLGISPSVTTTSATTPTTTTATTTTATTTSTSPTVAAIHSPVHGGSISLAARTVSPSPRAAHSPKYLGTHFEAEFQRFSPSEDRKDSQPTSPSRVTKRPRLAIKLSAAEPAESVHSLKNFLADTKTQKLVVQLNENDDLPKLGKFLREVQRQQITPASEKELVLRIEQPVTDPKQFASTIQEINETKLFSGVDLVGDAVVNTWANLKRVFQNNSQIANLRISGASSDAVCGCFKNWLSYFYTSAGNTNPGLKLTTLSFVDLEISDAAVFGAMLREMLAKMPNIATLDFSNTLLSPKQQDEIRFQLAAAGHDGLLKF